jgi:autotransporter-associated beta strand protein
MKIRKDLINALIPALFVTTAPVHADLYWDGTDTDGNANGGAGTWDTSPLNLNWDDAATGGNDVAWNNTTNAADRAVFGGATGLVTMGTDIIAGGITLSVANTIANGGFDLTLNNTGTALSGSAAATLSGAGTIIVNAATQTWSNTSGTMTVASAVNTGNNLLTLDTRSNNLDVTGKISGTGGLKINSNYSQANAPSNSGNATLNNGNDYTGTTTINGYIYLNSGGLSALGTDTSAIILNNGGFRLNGTGTVTRGLTLTGNNGIGKISGTTTLNGPISGGGNLDIRGNFAGLTVIGGAGAVVLGGANTFSGTASLASDGTLRLAHANALQNATLNMTLGDRSRVDLTTHNLAYNIGALTGSGSLDLGTGGGTGLVSIGSNNSSTTYTGILSGSAGINKTGSGTLTLTNANSYTGQTVVTDGTLALGASGSLASTTIEVKAGAFLNVSAVTGGYTLDSGKTLAGSGTVTGSLDVAGTLSPGSSPGTLSTGSQNWLTGGDYNWQIINTAGAAGTGYDTVDINGTLDLTSLAPNGFNINLWSLSGIGPDVSGDALNFDDALNYSWVLVSTTGGVTGFDAGDFVIHTGANNGAGGFSNTFTGDFSLAVSDDNLVLNYTAVPEPAAVLLGGLGLLTLLRRRR